MSLSKFLFASSCFFSLALIPFSANAQDTADLSTLQNELSSLRQLQFELDDRINAIEDRLQALAPEQSAPVVIEDVATQPQTAAAPAPQTPADRLTFGGDFRVRYEGNFSNDTVRNRSRGAMRARLRARYQINDTFAVGGQLSTGDPDDPNSADVTLSSFDDDLAVSLDQAYLQAKFANTELYLGKMPLPFRATDRLWDGDVSPQGVSANYEVSLSDASRLAAHSLFFLIDEAAMGDDSAMIGGQLELKHQLTPLIQTDFAIGYYNYRLHNTADADLGDFRTNLILGNTYLSDFEILSLIASVRWNEWTHWPIEIRGDYSHNFGAARFANAHTDDAFGIDLMAGKLANKGDTRFSYGYAQSDVDSTLAAFAQDNIDFGTNYVFHSIGVDYALSSHLFFNGSLYRYHLKDIQFAPAGETVAWRNRLRLNLMAKF
ncbi:putative porin [Hyphococcus lacteus]|uniref:Porin n=1 Tax=Hyphococcus lacteus TaxID=3143536 RepID=A0ABV3Z7K5_9PROT